MTKRAVVTGANSFIGKHLIKALEREKIKVIAIPHTLLTNHQALVEIFEEHKPHYIFHLAAYGNMPTHTDTGKIIVSNYLSSACLFEASKATPYTAFINISSSSVLLDKETMYSATKAGVERLAKAYAQQGKPIVTIRPYSIYGEGEQKEHFIPTVFRSCLSDEPMKLAPEPVHDWVYAEDLVDCIIKTAKDPKSFIGREVNCGTSWGTSNLAIVRLIENITGKKANITEHMKARDYDSNNWVASKFMGNLNFAKTTPLKGLTNVYNYLMEGGEK